MTDKTTTTEEPVLDDSEFEEAFDEDMAYEAHRDAEAEEQYDRYREDVGIELDEAVEELAKKMMEKHPSIFHSKEKVLREIKSTIEMNEKLQKL